MVHGVVFYWDESGKLIDTYSVTMGTGSCRSWYENGQRASDGQSRSGRYVGKVVIWDRDGKKLSTNYYLDGAEVSRKKYFEMARLDKTLPLVDQ